MAETFVKKLPICSSLDLATVASIRQICVFKVTYMYPSEETSCIYINDEDDVFAMGGNTVGCLGLGDENSRAEPVAIQQLCKQHVKTIAVGEGGHVLALTESGKVFSWGYNHNGQLGNGNSNNVPIPVQVTTTLQDKKIIQIACGAGHSMVLSEDGEIFAWGRNLSGQLGLGSGAGQSTPMRVSLSQVASISCGWVHSMAVLVNGEVYGWGWNNWGQLGLGHTDDQSSPCKVEGLSTAGIKQVVCGGWHTLALSEDGCVYSWGENDYGQLGTHDTTDRLSPHKMKERFFSLRKLANRFGKSSSTPSTLPRFIEIAACHYSDMSAGLTQTGKVYMWGECDSQKITSPRLTELSTTDEAFVLFSHDRATWRMYSVGDITQKGYEKKKARLLSPYVEQAGPSHQVFGPSNPSPSTAAQHRAQRRLTREDNPYHSDSSSDDDRVFDDDTRDRRHGRSRDSSQSTSSFPDTRAPPIHQHRNQTHLLPDRPRSPVYANISIPGNTARPALADDMQSARHDANVHEKCRIGNLESCTICESNILNIQAILFGPASIQHSSVSIRLYICNTTDDSRKSQDLQNKEKKNGRVWWQDRIIHINNYHKYDTIDSEMIDLENGWKIKTRKDGSSTFLNVEQKLSTIEERGFCILGEWMLTSNNLDASLEFLIDLYHIPKGNNNGNRNICGTLTVCTSEIGQIEGKTENPVDKSHRMHKTLFLIIGNELPTTSQEFQTFKFLIPLDPRDKEEKGGSAEGLLQIWEDRGGFSLGNYANLLVLLKDAKLIKICELAKTQIDKIKEHLAVNAGIAARAAGPPQS